MRNPDGGGYDIFVKSVGGSGAEERILADVAEWQVPTAFSPDGKFLLVQKRKQDRDDLFSLSLGSDRTLRPLATTPALETMGQFSPNGKYVSYVSDESGREEVYVTPFPEAGRVWQVSQNGGTEPRWRRDGKEMFFFTPENRLVAVDVGTEGDSFEVGEYHPLFQARLMGVGFRYDVSRDGQRFLVNAGIPDELSPISIVTSWTSELKKEKRLIP
jgi:dipeptidyl aminopeptidase/acylaminoacyl peptidase